MNANIIEAVLHLRKASDLLKDVHPKLSLALLETAGAFVLTDDDEAEVERMAAAADRISEGQDGPAS